MKTCSLKTLFIAVIFMPLISGCGAFRVLKKMTTPKPKPELPAMWVMPITCENGDISKKLTEGFIENIPKKIQVMDTRNYEMYLTSRITRFEMEKIRYAQEEGTAASTQPITLKIEPIKLSSSSFRDIINTVSGKEEDRIKFYHESGLDYLVFGKAKEKELDELELGNLLTAETAELKCISLKTGEFWIDEQFKQGMFEVVAPDRIGKKFAQIFEKKLKKTDKAAKKAEKLRRKRLKLEK